MIHVCLAILSHPERSHLDNGKWSVKCRFQSSVNPVRRALKREDQDRVSHYHVIVNTYIQSKYTKNPYIENGKRETIAHKQ